MKNIDKRAKAAALQRPRILWIALGTLLATLTWWAFRQSVQTAGASDTHHAHGAQQTDDDAHLAADEHDHGHHHPGVSEGPTAQITIWDEQYEIFAEHPLPVAGEPVPFIVHVTDRRTYRPRTEGPATFVLRHGGVVRATHVEPAPARPGIYTPELTFPLSAEWTVAVAIPQDEGEHVVELPPLHVYASAAEAARAPEPTEIEGVSFLKEEQWGVPVWVHTVQPEGLGDPEVPLVPESAVLHVDGREHVFVQVSGETFQMRSVDLGEHEGDRVQVLSGVTTAEHVATRGAVAILAATQRGDAAEHDHHDHAAADHGPAPIPFSAEDMERFGIEIGAAQAGCITKALTLTGEIRLNRDRMVQIVPRMTGIAREIRKNLGDPVSRGEVLAVIESRPLADAKADYLAARERKELAQAVYGREERLRQQEISSEQEYLDARQALTENSLLLRAARQKLLAMGFTADYLDRLPDAPDDELTRLEIVAPFDGVVIEKSITLGERVSDEAPAFVVANLNTVWLDLYAHERDVAGVRRGQRVALVARPGTPAASGTIDSTHPIVDETTRTVLVRAVLDNTAGKLRPGTFVTARVSTDETTSCVTVDRDAVQYLRDEPFVFIYGDGEFIPRSVALGKSDDRGAEIVGGVKPGEPLATKGSFRLKAEIEKRAAGDIGHGHAH